MAPRTALQSYRTIDAQGLTESQSPEMLILLLLEKAHSLLKQSKLPLNAETPNLFMKARLRLCRLFYLCASC